MRIKERILKIAENKGITKPVFCENIGLTYGGFTGDNKKRPINSDALANLLAIHPDVNLEWLLTGNGEMLKTNNIESQTPSQIDLSYLIEQLKIKDEQIRACNEQIKASNEQIKASNNQIKSKDKQIEKLLGNVDAEDAMGAVSRAVAL